MKRSIRYGAMIQCDMVTVSDNGTEHTDQCYVRFISYSVSSIVREQASAGGWARVRVDRVTWPGEPPMSDAKKVDLCPMHAKRVISEEEAKAAKAKRRDEAKAQHKAERAAARSEKKAEKKRQKEAARDVAKAVKAQKEKKRRGKAQEAAGV